MRASLPRPAFLALALILAGCPKGSDTHDSGTGDSDSVADSGTETGVTSDAFSKSDCLDHFAPPITVLTATDMGGGTVHVDHDGWQGNCCTDVAISLETVPPEIDVTYVETGKQCNCFCSFNLDYDLLGLMPGEWTIHAASDTATVKVGK
jgi:hypothetical protein